MKNMTLKNFTIQKSVKLSAKAFTLIELLVVIAIIGILATLVIVSLGNSRAKARDSKRLNDLKAMANALELYYANNNQYPASITPGQPLEANDIIYISKVPNNPTPRTDGDCPDSDYSYAVNASGTSYAMGFCLGSDVGSVKAGINTATSQGGIGNFGLRGWWQFNEGSGEVALDSSGNGYHGTWNGTSVNRYGEGKAGTYAAYFNGLDDYVQLPNIGSMTSFTIMGWIRGDGDSLTGATGYNSFTSGRLLYTVSDSLSGGRRMLAQVGAGSHFSDSLMPRGQYHHIAYVYENSLSQWYINGVANTTNAGAVVFPSSPRIGSEGSINYMMNGLIDDVRIYNRVLSAEEIKAIFEIKN